MSYLRISDKFKQQARESNVDKSAYYYLIDSVDVHFAVNAFQYQLNEEGPSIEENYAYIITDPYNLHENFGGAIDSASGLYTLSGKIVGTGDIVRSVRLEDRIPLGTTYNIFYDASSTGEKAEESLGNLGQIIFNDYDKRHYGWNGTTWSDLVSDYVKSVVKVGGSIAITKGNGVESIIPIGIDVGVSGESSLFSQKINFVQGNNMDINISAVGTTANVQFSVNEIIAGTMS